MDKPIVKHSNAPPPITPLGGSSYRPPTWKKADWSHWEQMPHCKIWDIVALSLDLEPSNPKHEIRTWPPEYSNRLQITNAHIECGKLTRSKADWHSIDMTNYGTWAQSIGWSLPERFPHDTAEKKSAPTEVLPKTHTVNRENKAIKDEPKKVIMRVFSDIHFSYEKWGSNLANVPKWLEPCLVARGSKAKRVSHRWNPVLIGLALLDKGITFKRLDLAFMGLKEWKDEWEEKTDLMR